MIILKKINIKKKKKFGILFFYFQYMYVHLCSSALKFKTRRLHVCHLRYLFSYLKKSRYLQKLVSHYVLFY